MTTSSSTTTTTSSSGGSKGWFSWLLPSAPPASESSSSSSTSPKTLPPTYAKGFHHDLEPLRRMRYRPLGRTDMQVSVLSLGASSLGGMFDSVDDEDEAVDVVHRALKAGINLIDTAPWYNKSERILGLALRNVPRKAYYLNTKVGRYPMAAGGNEDTIFDFRSERVTKSVYDSLTTLGVSYLDCVHVHDVEFCPDVLIILHETLPALARLKEQGLIRYVGIAGYPLALLSRLVQDSPVPLDTCLSYCHHTLVDTTLLGSGLVSVLEEKGVGLINASPLAMGLLTHKGPPAWHPATEAQKRVCRQAADYCRQQGDVDIARLALRFTLSEPRIATTLVSTASVAELNQNVQAMHTPLNPKEEKVLRYIQQHFFATLKGRESWEGVEVNAYLQAVGARHILTKVYGRQQEEAGSPTSTTTTTSRRKRQRAQQKES